MLLLSFASASVGTTASIGGLYDGTQWVPSLDWRARRWLVQLHVLDQLAPLASGEPLVLDTGVDVSVVALRRPVDEPPLSGVLMPGLGVRLAGADWNLTAFARLGVELDAPVSLGVYVAPALGVTTLLSDTVRVNFGGTLQVSAWLR